MILVEEKLGDGFATLPMMTIDGKNYQPAYDFGSHEDLLRFLKSKRLEGVSFYPLIWLETPIEITGKDDRPTVKLKLIMATNSNSNLSNKERLEITYKTILIPLYNNIITLLKSSGFTRLINQDKKKVSKHYNYTENNEAFGTDIWDVIKLEHDVEFTACELRNFNY